MKKLLLLLVSALLLSSCADFDNDQLSDYMDTAIGEEVHDPLTNTTIRVIVQEDVVVSPTWIEEVRKEMASSPSPSATSLVFVFSVEIEGGTYIYFWNGASSSAGSRASERIYNLDGTESKYVFPLINVDGSDFFTHRRLLCPRDEKGVWSK